MQIKKLFAPSSRPYWLACLLALSPNVCVAELILSIDWDPNTPGVQTTLNLNTEVNSTVTASIIAELTGGSTLYLYRVSVRYDSERLEYLRRVPEEETRSPGMGASFSDIIPDSEPAPLAPQSGDGFSTFREIQRFDGEEVTGQGFFDASSAGIGAGLVLGVIEFRLLSTSGHGPLVKPGLYETAVDDDAGGEVRIDNLTGNLGLIGGPLSPTHAPNPDTTLIVQVGTLTAVPEPSSIFLVVFAGFVVFFRREFLGLAKSRAPSI